MFFVFCLSIGSIGLESSLRTPEFFCSEQLVNFLASDLWWEHSPVLELLHFWDHLDKRIAICPVFRLAFGLLPDGTVAGFFFEEDSFCQELKNNLYTFVVLPVFFGSFVILHLPLSSPSLCTELQLHNNLCTAATHEMRRILFSFCMIADAPVDAQESLFALWKTTFRTIGPCLNADQRLRVYTLHPISTIKLTLTALFVKLIFGTLSSTNAIREPLQHTVFPVSSLYEP